MGSWFCEEKEFENYILFFLDNNNWEKLDNLLIERFDRHYDQNTINLTKIFRKLGEKKINGEKKYLLLKKIISCIDCFDDKILSNQLIVEIIRNDADLKDEIIIEYGILDCIVDGVDFSYWLYRNNKLYILDRYLAYFSEEIPWLIFKYKKFKKYENKFISYLESKEVKSNSRKVNVKLKEIILITEYGVSAIIQEDEIKKLEINNKNIEDFISKDNYIYKIILHVCRDLKEDENIFEDFNDITAVQIVTDDKTYSYQIPLFHENKYGINYLQRYEFSNKLAKFEYDYNSLENDLFDNAGFQAKIKADLGIKLNNQLCKKDLYKIEKLNLIFNASIQLYDYNEIINCISKFTNLKTLILNFIGYDSPIEFDFNNVIGLESLKLIKITGLEQVEFHNCREISDNNLVMKYKYDRNENIIDVTLNNI